MSAVRTSPDITQISLDSDPAYHDGLTTLQRLRSQRAEVEAAHQEAARIATGADMEAVELEAAAMIGEGDKKAGAAARVRFEQAQAKMLEAQRQLRTIDEALRIQKEKVSALLSDARAHVMRVTRALHEPVMQRAVALMRQLAEVLQEHEQIKMAHHGALGGLYNLANPRFPEVTFDRVEGFAGIYGTVDNIIRELREAKYDI